MFALLAHITMEEEPFIAAAVGLSFVAGVIGGVIASFLPRRNKVKSED